MGQIRKPKTDEIAQAIKIDIAQGYYPVGKPLIQETLAKRYGVSRIPVREALKTLAAEGVVDIHPGAGTYVSSPTSEEIVEIFEIRVQLEPHLLRLSIPRLGPRDFEAAQAAIDGMVQKKADVSPFTHDTAFHEALFAGTDRPLHKNLLRSLRTRIAGLYADDNFWSSHKGTSVDEHRAILEAIKAGRNKEASSLLIRHIMRAREAISAKVAVREQFR